jgi:hypothetical protein
VPEGTRVANMTSGVKVGILTSINLSCHYMVKISKVENVEPLILPRLAESPFSLSRKMYLVETLFGE